MRHPDDYRLERWLAVLFSLLFLLPVVADAQPVPDAPTLPGCVADVAVGSPSFHYESDVKPDVPAPSHVPSIRVADSGGEVPCSLRY